MPLVVILVAEIQWAVLPIAAGEDSSDGVFPFLGVPLWDGQAEAEVLDPPADALLLGICF